MSQRDPFIIVAVFKVFVLCVCGTLSRLMFEKAHHKRDDVPLGLVSHFCFDRQP